MRQLAHIPNEAQAKSLGDYLYLQKIENTIEREDDGVFVLWIHDDAHLSVASDIYQRFMKDPGNPEFQSVTLKAKFQRAREKRDQLVSRNKHIDIRTQWHKRSSQMGRLTLALIIVSVGVALVSQLGANRTVLQPLFISSYDVVGKYVQWRVGLPQIMSGQVWRLITPIFIHFGLLHLIFNMLWLKDLGTMIERHQSSLILGMQVLVMGALSNVAQYWMSGPTFGGMSGVVYGLLGYIWIRGHFDPGSKLFLHKTIVWWMLGWFVLCLTGLVGSVANTAHAVGLGVGIIWGYLSSGHLLKVFHR